MAKERGRREPGSNPVGSDLFFSVLYMVFPLNFVNIFLAYNQRYRLEISTATGVIDLVESEYAIFILQGRILQNSSGVICAYIS